MSATYLTINTPNVIFEEMEGEVVIINLARGFYYSLNQVGTEIWNLLKRGITKTQLIAEITDQYQPETIDIDNAVNHLLTQLQQEELITIANENNNLKQDAGNYKVGETAIHFKTIRNVFIAPILKKYNDIFIAYEPNEFF